MDVDLMYIDKMNSRVLAYVGDAVYELEIRKYLVKKGACHVCELQKQAINYVSAVNQAKILDNLINNKVLNENELSIIRRAKNHKQSSKPKYANIIEYKKATALEALFGMHYLTDNKERINELVKEILGD